MRPRAVPCCGSGRCSDAPEGSAGPSGDASSATPPQRLPDITRIFPVLNKAQQELMGTEEPVPAILARAPPAGGADKGGLNPPEHLQLAGGPTRVTGEPEDADPPPTRGAGRRVGAKP